LVDDQEEDDPVNADRNPINSSTKKAHDVHQTADGKPSNVLFDLHS
jgi:hypothetical protein